MTRILCTGAATWDIIFQVPAFPVQPTKVLADNCVETSAGMASAAAMAIAALGGDAAIYARLGQDAQAERWLEGAAAAGVDVSLVERVPDARSAISTIIVDGSGDRLIVPYYDRRLRNAPPAIDGQFMSRFDYFLVDTRWPEASRRILEFAAQHERPVLLDADIAPLEVLQDLAPLASHVIFSREALALLVGEGPAAEALRLVNARKDALLGVTDGAAGCALLTGGTVTTVPAPKVKAIDTLAAGDVFHGAFILGLAEGKAPEEAARFANAAAALKCTRFGGIAGRPSREEVERLLAAQAE